MSLLTRIHRQANTEFNEAILLEDGLLDFISGGATASPAVVCGACDAVLSSRVRANGSVETHVDCRC